MIQREAVVKHARKITTKTQNSQLSNKTPVAINS